MRTTLARIAAWMHYIGAFGTWIYLTFFDGYIYTWWNWIIAVPINSFLAAIWPISWPLKWLMGL